MSTRWRLVGLASLPSLRAASPVHLECRYRRDDSGPGEHFRRGGGHVLGSVIGIHIRDDVIVNGLVDVMKMKPIARLGYFNYAVVDNVFSIDFPD